MQNIVISPAPPGLEGDDVRSNEGEGKAPPKRGRGKKEERPDGNVGDALRAVYHDAVSESVPDEMLDLLRKLG